MRPPLTTSSLIQDFAAVREHTLALVAPLSAEDCCVQSMPDASPAKWHLAHTTWFFETFVLEAYEPGFQPFHAAYRVLFNSYYHGVGAQHPRAQRGLLTRPTLDEVLAYRTHVDARMRDLLTTSGESPDVHALVVLGLNHEQQHQELLLTDILHLFSRNPLHPSYAAALPSRPPTPPLVWHSLPGGVTHIGYDLGYGGPEFCFDNETPRHAVYLQPFQMASRLVSNAEYAAFMDAGGYTKPVYWLSEGWEWRCTHGVECPLYWSRSESASESEWMAFTLGGLARLDPHAPVLHLSYYEADAYARWAGARLPTEAEWEVGATAAQHQEAQWFDEAWQWTQSSYAAYPGYQPSAGAVGEYNGKFMVNQYVLRGGSCATPSGHTRPSYRNFFPTATRWQFTSIRLARDGG